ncbi:hypothetical protein [Mammaliicoccus phage vB_MscM-PMS3]|nr:hypothetical protein [Mammaliicoccus phage vB_MscM-PMS3]WBF82246.1 hypothetical protein [Mammaliicoccus virus vB_MscM-PMS2]
MELKTEHGIVKGTVDEIVEFITKLGKVGTYSNVETKDNKQDYTDLYSILYGFLKRDLALNAFITIPKGTILKIYKNKLTQNEYVTAEDSLGRIGMVLLNDINELPDHTKEFYEHRKNNKLYITSLYVDKNFVYSTSNLALGVPVVKGQVFKKNGDKLVDSLGRVYSGLTGYIKEIPPREFPEIQIKFSHYQNNQSLMKYFKVKGD